MITTTPILLILFNRPEKTKVILETLNKIKPKKIFVSADGPRENFKDDIKLCNEVRNLINKISWNCKIETNFSEKNLSLKKT